MVRRRAWCRCHPAYLLRRRTAGQCYEGLKGGGYVIAATGTASAG
jgi:hypothetical protein